MSERLLARIVAWATAREDVRAAVLIGSHARTERPADRYSDIDVILFARDPAALLDDRIWPRALGDVGITFVEQTPVPGVRERRVLFRDGTDVDFVAVPVERIHELVDRGSDVLSRGYRVLVDKDGVSALLAGVGERTASEPVDAELAEAVSDFWYHAVWTARKLRRGELFVAKECLDGYLGTLVVRMAGWHAGDPGPLHGARYLEEWADEQVLSGLRAASARYDPTDVARALHASMDLFARLARETAGRLGSAYAEDEETLARELVQRVLVDAR